MGFEIEFLPFRYDGTTERIVNPFTRQEQDVARNLPLSKDEVAAVLAVLEKAGAKLDDDGQYLFQSADGANATIDASDIAKGCTIAIRPPGLTPQLARLLFDVMVAGDWGIFRLEDEDFVITPNEACAKRIPPELGRGVVASSGEDVAALLTGARSAS